MSVEPKFAAGDGPDPQHAPSRRSFLEGALIGAVGTAVAGSGLPARALAHRQASATTPSNAIILGLGGGARFSETFGDEKHRFIPNIWSQLVPRGTYYDNVWGRGALDHSVGYKNLLSGRWSEAQSDVPYRATIFEHYRKQTGAGPRSAWCGVWGSDVANHFLGFSFQPEFGPRYGALMSHPKSLMAWWKAAKKNGKRVEEPDIPYTGYSRRPFPYAPADEEIREDLYDLVTQHPEFQDTGVEMGVDATRWEQEMNRILIRRVLTTYRPRVAFFGFCAMDVAHESGFDAYCEGIAATDAAIAEVCSILDTQPEYKDRTVVVVTPEIGRDQGDDPRQPISYRQHTGDTVETNHRHGLVIYGPGVRRGVVVDRKAHQVSIAPTVARLVGFPVGEVDGEPLEEALI